MKKIFLVLTVILFSFSVVSAQGGEGIRFEEGTFQQVLDKAKAEDKLVFVDVYATWCVPCQKMASEVFTQKSVGDYFNTYFVNAKFDAEKAEGGQLVDRYGVRAFPTFLLLDGDGRLVGTMIGGSPAEDFIKKIDELRTKGS